VARYFVIPATLFCFVLAAIAFTAGKRRHAVMIIAVLAIFMAVRAPWIYGPKQDWKSAAQYVKKNFKRNDLVVAVFSNRLSFGYYFNIPVDLYTISNLIRKEYVKDRDVWVIDITPKNESKVAELLSRSPTIWVVFSSGQRFQEEAFIDQMLYRNDFGNVIVRRFEGVDIILYTKQQAKKVTP